MFIRSKDVVLRKEVFKGMAFHKKKIGITIELDSNGQYLLETLDPPKRIEYLLREMLKVFQRKYSECEIEKFIISLTEMGFINRDV